MDLMHKMMNEALALRVKADLSVAKLLSAHPNRKVPGNGKRYAIINVGRNRYLNLAGDDGTTVIGWSVDNRTPAENEKWLFTERGNKFTLQTITAAANDSFVYPRDGTDVRDAPKKVYRGNQQVEWELERISEEQNIFLIKGEGGQCLTSVSEKREPFTDVQLELHNRLEDYESIQHQLWFFIEV